MRVLHLIDTFCLGGAQVLLRDFFNRQKDNRDIFLLAIRKKEFAMSTVHDHLTILDSRAKYSLWPLWQIKNHIVKNRIDLIHCHLFRSQFFGWLVKKIWFPNIKLIFHDHGTISLKKNYVSFFFRLAAKDINAFIAVSCSVKKHLTEYAKINPQKIFVVYNFAGQPNQEQVLPSSGHAIFTVGFVGRLHKIKGVHHLLAAFSRWHFPAKLIIVGDGPYKRRLLDLSRRLKITNRVDFVGYQENVFNYYTQFDVLVVPSLFEAFGLVALEAQAAAVPVIASDVGGLPEVIFDGVNGLIFRAGNISDLSAKVEKIYRDRALRSLLVKNGLENVKKYSWSEYLRELNAVYLWLNR